MSVEILMPELGESVHEGTVSRWLKKVGDQVKEDEPVVEIMTDKVNTELGAPASGVLSEILIPEGGTVEVFKAMGLISPGSLNPSTPEAAKPTEQAQPAKSPGQPAKVEEVEEIQSLNGEGERKFYTPVVRSIAKERDISDSELAKIAGSGGGGRVTKSDLEAFLETRGAEPKSVPLSKTELSKPPSAVPPSSGGQDQIPLIGMRKMIAEAMVRSSQIPTVSTVTQCDVTTMVAYRDANKDFFLKQNGVKLTYTPFFIKALTEALLEFPLVNSSLNANNAIQKNKEVNMGIAVALGSKGDEGLIVPVIKNCETKHLVEIAKGLDEIAKSARSNSLKPTDVQGGTFTLTNPGTYGAMFGTPMINAPQAAILGTYAITKMPVIMNDMIAIRSIMHLVLTYDHRIIDGLLAGKFLASVRDKLQTFDFFR